LILLAGIIPNLILNHLEITLQDLS
jgi:hypothetical protein